MYLYDLVNKLTTLQKIVVFNRYDLDILYYGLAVDLTKQDLLVEKVLEIRRFQEYIEIYLFVDSDLDV